MLWVWLPIKQPAFYKLNRKMRTTRSTWLTIKHLIYYELLQWIKKKNMKLSGRSQSYFILWWYTSKFTVCVIHYAVYWAESHICTLQQLHFFQINSSSQGSNLLMNWLLTSTKAFLCSANSSLACCTH